MKVDSIIELIFENLETDCEEIDGEHGQDFNEWVTTGKAKEALQKEYPELKIEKIEKILEVIEDRVEINWTKSKEEEGWVDWIEYDLDSKGENKIKEILENERI